MPAFYLHPFFWVLIALLLLQWGIYLLLFRRLAFYRLPENIQAPAPPVSVIIAAQNEKENLLEKLPLILNQDYPVFEVIVVNDQSWDSSGLVLEEMAKEYSHLKVVTIQEHVREFAGKKLALTLGIKAAAYEHLLFTDADCKPESANWIRCMASSYTGQQTQIVLGYSPYLYRPGMLNAVIRFDTLYTALQYMSMAMARNPYMGVGRNMSYRKSLFFEKKGFAPYLKVASGDDDLFVNTHADSNNTEVQLHPDSFMWSEPKETWSDWMRQKRRHLSVGKLYRAGHKRMLGFIWLSHFLFIAAVIAGIFVIKPFWVAPAVYGLRLAVVLPVMYGASRRLRSGNLWLAVPLIELFYQMLYQPFMSLISIFRRRRKRW